MDHNTIQFDNAIIHKGGNPALCPTCKSTLAPTQLDLGDELIDRHCECGESVRVVFDGLGGYLYSVTGFEDIHAERDLCSPWDSRSGSRG